MSIESSGATATIEVVLVEPAGGHLCDARPAHPRLLASTPSSCTGPTSLRRKGGPSCAGTGPHAPGRGRWRAARVGSTVARRVRRGRRLQGAARQRRLMAECGVAVDAAVEAQLQALEDDGKTAMWLATGGRLAGVIAVADTVKDNAIAQLQRGRVAVVMLTGDNERTAQAIARQVGIDRVVANVPPQDKAAEIQRLRDAGEVVAMVGDGINDSPALATAEIGIDIGSGSDVAKETGGLILIKDDLRDVAVAIRLSRATMRKIRQNLFWAFGYNTAAIPIAAAGLLNPIIAAAAMALSSLSVITNSATLKRLHIGERS